MVRMKAKQINEREKVPHTAHAPLLAWRLYETWLNETRGNQGAARWPHSPGVERKGEVRKGEKDG